MSTTAIGTAMTAGGTAIATGIVMIVTGTMIEIGMVIETGAGMAVYFWVCRHPSMWRPLSTCLHLPITNYSPYGY